MHFFAGRITNKQKKNKNNNKASSSSMILTDDMELIIDRLKLMKHRNSTRKSYYAIWKSFSSFFLKLDRRPPTWEEKLTLFVAYLVDSNKKASTIKSYISAIKAVLAEDNITLSEDKYLLNSLIKACQLNNDKLQVRLPIHKDLLHVIIKSIKAHFQASGQNYLATLYSAMVAMAYYGLFRIGEITNSPHVLKVDDVHIGTNKKKLLFILHSSKTHTRGSKPQSISISSVETQKTTQFCPFKLMQDYIRVRKRFKSKSEQFFVFKDRSKVKPQHLHAILKLALKMEVSITGFIASMVSGRAAPLTF